MPEIETPIEDQYRDIQHGVVNVALDAGMMISVWDYFLNPEFGLKIFHTLNARLCKFGCRVDFQIPTPQYPKFF